MVRTAEKGDTMKCFLCGSDTEIGDAYLLPKIVKDAKGYINIVACSKEHRDAWKPIDTPTNEQETAND